MSLVDKFYTSTGAVAQLDQMTQQNAALVEESAAAAESLREQAERLYGVVGTFQLNSATAEAVARAVASASRARPVTAPPSGKAVTPVRAASRAPTHSPTHSPRHTPHHNPERRAVSGA